MFTNMFYENILDYVRIWKYCPYTSFTCAPKLIGLHFWGFIGTGGGGINS